MPRTFAPQQPSRYDGTLQLWIPSMNLEPARKYGDLTVMLPPGANSLHIAPLVAALKERMADFGADDWLIAVGDPSLIAAAACIAVRNTGGVLRLLKWDRQAGDYLPTEMKL